MAADIPAVAGVIWRGPKLLAVQRPEGKIMAGFWEFPGGKIEPGETPVQALGRELEEELGIRAGRVEWWKHLAYTYVHGSIRLEVFHVLEFEGEPRPLESQVLSWVTPAEALELPFLPADFPLLRELAVTGSPA